MKGKPKLDLAYYLGHFEDRAMSGTGRRSPRNLG